MVFRSNPEPMWLCWTSQHDGFLCNAIWGLKGHAFTWGFLPCPTQTEISLNSLNLFTILCIVVGVRPKFFASLLWEMWFLICSTLIMKFGTKLLANTGMLLLYPNMIPSPTNWPAYCGLSQNSLTWIFYNIFTFI